MMNIIPRSTVHVKPRGMSNTRSVSWIERLTWPVIGNTTVEQQPPWNYKNNRTVVQIWIILLAFFFESAKYLCHGDIHGNSYLPFGGLAALRKVGDLHTNLMFCPSWHFLQPATSFFTRIPSTLKWTKWSNSPGIWTPIYIEYDTIKDSYKDLTRKCSARSLQNRSWHWAHLAPLVLPAFKVRSRRALLYRQEKAILCLIPMVGTTSSTILVQKQTTMFGVVSRIEGRKQHEDENFIPNLAETLSTKSKRRISLHSDTFTMSQKWRPAKFSTIS